MIVFTSDTLERITIDALERTAFVLVDPCAPDASSLLGINPEDIEVESEGLDAIRELANILGGSVLHDIGGQQSEFSLGLPTMVDAMAESDSATCWFVCEGESLTVSCHGLKRNCIGRIA